MKMSIVSKFATALGVFLLAGVTGVFAQEAAADVAGRADVLKWLALASPIGLGLAVIGCALGQGRMAAQAMAGIARNPGAAKDMFVPMILGLAFIEALAIYALIFVFIFRAAFPL
jgi:F-type H+-transporting ATPase subunit c